MPEEFKWVIESDREDTYSPSSISDWETLRLAHCSKEDYRGNGNKLTKVKLLDIKPEIDSDKKVYKTLPVVGICECGKKIKFSNYIGSKDKVNFKKGMQKCGCGNEEFFAESFEHYHGNFDSNYLVHDFRLRCVKCGKVDEIIEAF